ncbi:response regulator [Actibacterium sp. XHP0104]|uniref:hybrid sensor histidine kinase/response regulator n=1 Tax=Actibacterium sp. XHP0104 TaxID=2984335 RepID=UPI0021E93A5A|nr:response regulator [Actibacterium sp. XHP0104]MCV2881747.1 response regulator [Actibacterium sp. XHP0104]
MNLEDKLAEERRGRLAAERLLDQKTRELFDANAKLSQHARHLSDEIVETRQQAEKLRGQNTQIAEELREVSTAYAIAERRLWDSLETIHDGFAVFDADNRLVAANPAYLGMFDGLEDVRIGASYAEIIQLMADEGIIDTQGLSRADWVARALTRWDQDPVPDTVVRLWNGQYIRQIERRTPGGDMVCLHLNQTDMMRMWAAVEAVPDGFVLYDNEDRLVMCNDRYRQIYSDSAPAMQPGTTFEEILRYGLERGQYHEGIGREEEWLAERMIRHQKADGVIEQHLADGRWLRILEKQTPDGGRVGLRVDITDQKEQQSALDDARVAAEAANRAKSAFLANMSHELRTPMNGVVGMAELLCDTTLSEEQRLYAETIRNSGGALLGLLNDVLDYSKIEAAKLNLFPEPFDLERTIHEVVMLLQATAHDKAVALLIDYDLFMPTCYLGDPGRIRQILTNLIGNAVKFTQEGHVLIRVVGFEGEAPGSRQIHLTVEDTGIGIAPDMQDHIFGEFNQVEDQQNRKFEGTGLGLAITRQLVEMMGGEIWVDSEKGQGSCFGVALSLPLAEEIEPHVALPATSFRTAMVIDDQDINRTILERQLEQMGLTVSCYRNADLAQEALDTGDRPDLIVTDDRMPGLSGRDFARRLREAGDETPILLLSSNPTGLRASGQGATAVMTKPVLRRSLYDMVATLGPVRKQARECRPMRVLAAEDNRTNRLVFSKMLKGLNLDLHFVENGEEAVAAHAEQPPDLIFMDISMPIMDGKTATRAIRTAERDSGAPRVPIVAMTAHAMEGDAEDILAAGLDHYLTKPLSKDAIHEMIHRYWPEGCEDLTVAAQASG